MADFKTVNRACSHQYASSCLIAHILYFCFFPPSNLTWPELLVQINKYVLRMVKSWVEANILLDGVADMYGRFPWVPQLCWKLLNFLWIVNCVSHSTNVQWGFNDSPFLFESMFLLHPGPILWICCATLCLQQTVMSLCSSVFSSQVKVKDTLLSFQRHIFPHHGAKLTTEARFSQTTFNNNIKV